jgi:ATP-dependent DNA helicase PIF1
MTQETALTILKTGVNVFLTGEPGAGKSYTINRYVEYLRQHGIEPSITASTGIAATHIGGITIHSWSGIGIKTELDKNDLNKIAANATVVRRVRRTSALIIDEISMLTPETLAMVDVVCRKLKNNAAPFGGIQVVFVGDFFQLPPVRGFRMTIERQTSLIESESSPFCYTSAAWVRARPTVCYLTEQYRQDDPTFLGLLNAIRQNTFSADHAELLTTRKVEPLSAPQDAPKLFSHNTDVDRVNTDMLARLPGKSETFTMTSWGGDGLVAALVRGCLSPETLYLKVGATVMFTKNNPKEGFVNGTLGTVTGFQGEHGTPVVLTKSGKHINVETMDWTVEENGKVRAHITQLPLRLAWAMTVHKSQGVSLDEAVIDLRSVFEFGQGYVALSRVRRLSGLHLLGWNEQALQVHPHILAQDEHFRIASNEAELRWTGHSAAELENAHQTFIIAAGGTVEARDITEKNDEDQLDTYAKTLALWSTGQGVTEIATARKITEGTVVGHLEQLTKDKKIKRKELDRLLTPALQRALPQINAAFQTSSDGRLSSVFAALKGAYSYDELRIVRLLRNDPGKA